MKKIILSLILFTLMFPSFSQEKKKNSFQIYGFFRNYVFVDSRKNEASTADLTYLSPLPKKMEGNKDVNAQPSFQMFAISSRLGLKSPVLEYNRLKISSLIETDFNVLKDSKVALLRLRLAYIQLSWDKVFSQNNSSFSLQLGQAWHPMAIDIPYSINVERGLPFNPFNRSPLIMASYCVNKTNCLSLTLVSQMQYLSTGELGRSRDYSRYGLVPEIVLQWQYKTDNITSKLGVDLLTISPNPANYSKRFMTYSPYLYLNYTKDSFSINAKTVFAQAGEHLSLLSSYAISRQVSDNERNYTPMQSTTSFISAKYGRKWQIMGMLAYMKLLGTTNTIAERGYFDPKSKLKGINQMFRITPTVAYNLDKFTIALEYNLTAAQFGNADSLGERALYLDSLYWLVNHRFSTMIKYRF